MRRSLIFMTIFSFFFSLSAMEWNPVGSAGFSAGGVYHTNIAIDSNDTPYVIYRDKANNDKVTVMIFDEYFSAEDSEVGTHCDGYGNGGRRIRKGYDDGNPAGTADNGILETDEVDTTTYICYVDSGPEDGHNSLLAIDDQVGTSCDAYGNGGQRIQHGIDDGDGAGTADDGSLHADEVDGTAYVCNGADGAAGADGHNTLIHIDDQVGASCDAYGNGGQRIRHGIDNGDGSGTADDGSLHADEVDGETFICNGADGADGADGHDSLVTVSDEPAGGNCANGGKKIDVGVDADDNGTLEADEISSTSYVCHGEDGADGADGHNSLTAVSDEPAGGNCTVGGKKIDVGVDTDDSGTLDADEISATSYICHGEDGTDGADGDNGKNALVSISDEPAGENCENGGKKVESGIDDNENGTLDADEVDTTEYVCNGDDGTDGEDGSEGPQGPAGEDGVGTNALTATQEEPEGENCEHGGIRIDTGQDSDDDGELSEEEIQNTSYVCNPGTTNSDDGGCSLTLIDHRSTSNFWSAIIILLGLLFVGRAVKE